MTDANSHIFEYLTGYDYDKEVPSIELVQTESRLEDRILEDRIKEVKTELKGDIMQVRTDLKEDILQVKTDLENNIREVKTDLENDIQIIRDDIKDRISGLRWFIGTTVAIAAIVVPLISKYL